MYISRVDIGQEMLILPFKLTTCEELIETSGSLNCYLRGCMLYVDLYMSRPMGKPTICIGENKGADQLRSNCEADQRLCFRYWDSKIPLLLKSEISSF